MVGILTFHRAANYGAVLQSYALQQTLNEMGFENEIIDYRCEHIKNHYSPKPSVSIKHIRRFTLDLLEAPQKAKTRKSFEKFLDEYLITSKPLSKEELSEYSEKYSTVICGSDQVWNPISTNEDFSFFLDFVSSDKRKVSYAASVGVTDWSDDFLNKSRECLMSFNAVSIREPESLELIKKVYKGEVSIDADPTILLEEEKWDSLAESSRLNDKEFIFLYVMQPSSKLYDIAERLSVKYGLKIVSISATEKKCKIGSDVKGSSVIDFLWMIKHATYIVTNSFHGLIFSMIFEKEFFWDYQEGKSMSNSRFKMLSKQYGIGCRCYDSTKQFKDYSEIDFTDVKKKMKEQKKKAIYYLNSNL